MSFTIDPVDHAAHVAITARLRRQADIARMREKETPTTPYLRWREKHISFYECGADRKTMPEYRARFEKIRMEFAIQLGLRKRQVKCRLIGCTMSIYVTKADFEKRRSDMRSIYRDSKDYSHFLYGLLVGSHNPRTR